MNNTPAVLIIAGSDGEYCYVGRWYFASLPVALEFPTLGHLAVHKDGKMWTITHMDSGRVLVQNCPTRKQAMDAAVEKLRRLGPDAVREKLANLPRVGVTA